MSVSVKKIDSFENIKFTFRGLIAPVFSPFHNDTNQSLNLSIIPEYAKYLAEKNVNGVLVNGTTGEGTSLTIDERKLVAKAWSSAVKDTKQHLMIQIGGTNLKDVQELAVHAESINVDSLLCLPELYFKPANVERLTEYLQVVAKSAPKTPLLYYHIPSQSSVNVNMGQFLEYVRDKIPTFAGIKFTSNDLDEAHQAFTANDHRFAVFLGSDVCMSAGCTLGLDSFIMTSLNFIPEPALELLEFQKGKKNLKQARENQEFIIKTVKKIAQYGTWVETMKMAMNLTTKIFVGPPRLPLRLLSKDDTEGLADNLKNIGIKLNKQQVFNLY